jgi:hypothetical protein
VPLELTDWLVGLKDINVDSVALIVTVPLPGPPFGAISFTDTVPLPPLWAGALTFSIERIPEVLSETTSFPPPQPDRKQRAYIKTRAIRITGFILPPVLSGELQ